MIGRPADTEAPAHFWTYINQTSGDDALALIEAQLHDASELLERTSERSSLHRYAPEKWSIRQLLNHITDSERIFAYRLLWIARGFDAPLPGFDQEVAAAGAQADLISWSALVDEFRQVRLSTIALYRNMPPESWNRSSIINGNSVSARAMAFIIPGHAEHHFRILREKYL